MFLGKKFTLTFTKLEMRSSSNALNSSILKILGGEELTSPVVLKTYGDGMPPSIQVPASSIMVTLSVAPHSHVSFDLEYSLQSSGASFLFFEILHERSKEPMVDCAWMNPMNSLDILFILPFCLCSVWRNSCG